MTDESPYRKSAVAAAWGVHLFTSLGVVLGLLALVATQRGEPREALLWLLLALLVDGVDGTLARAARVQDRLPRIDGAALDLIIDYLNYVLVPVMLILDGRYLPEPLALPLAAAILISSLYVFARRDMKTDDGYFRGFPALWTVVALYLLVNSPGPSISAVVVGVLVIMTFAPVHVPHPFRARDFGWLLPALAIGWAVSSVLMLVAAISGPNAKFAILSMLCAGALLAIGLLRSVRGPRST